MQLVSTLVSLSFVRSAWTDWFGLGHNEPTILPTRQELEKLNFLSIEESFSFDIDCQGLGSEEECNSALESAKLVGSLIAKDLLFRIPIKVAIGFSNSIEAAIGFSNNIEIVTCKTELDKPICI